MAFLTPKRPGAALSRGRKDLPRPQRAAGPHLGRDRLQHRDDGLSEILTDPSYTGQPVTLTTATRRQHRLERQDMECGKIAAAGLIVNRMTDVPSNWRATESLTDSPQSDGDRRDHRPRHPRAHSCICAMTVRSWRDHRGGGR